MPVTPAPPARVTLLGGFALRLGDDAQHPVRDLPRAIQRLVAHLGLSRCPHRNAVAGALWPDVPEDPAHGRPRRAPRRPASRGRPSASSPPSACRGALTATPWPVPCGPTCPRTTHTAASGRRCGGWGGRRPGREVGRGA